MLTVTVSEFRNNLADYLELIRKNKRVSITDGRRGKVLVTLKKEKKVEFDWDEHMKFIESIGGKLFTDKDVEAIKDLRRRSRQRAKRLNW